MYYMWLNFTVHGSKATGIIFAHTLWKQKSVRRFGLKREVEMCLESERSMGNV